MRHFRFVKVAVGIALITLCCFVSFRKGNQNKNLGDSIVHTSDHKDLIEKLKNPEYANTYF